MHPLFQNSSQHLAHCGIMNISGKLWFKNGIIGMSKDYLLVRMKPVTERCGLGYCTGGISSMTKKFVRGISSHWICKIDKTSQRKQLKKKQAGCSSGQ